MLKIDEINRALECLRLSFHFNPGYDIKLEGRRNLILVPVKSICKVALAVKKNQLLLLVHFVRSRAESSDNFPACRSEWNIEQLYVSRFYAIHSNLLRSEKQMWIQRIDEEKYGAVLLALFDAVLSNLMFDRDECRLLRNNGYDDWYYEHFTTFHSYSTPFSFLCFFAKSIFSC